MNLFKEAPSFHVQEMICKTPAVFKEIKTQNPIHSDLEFSLLFLIKEPEGCQLTWTDYELFVELPFVCGLFLFLTLLFYVTGKAVEPHIRCHLT